MNKDNLELWLRDLETTDEPQASSYLTVVGKGDCCLGRLCKVAMAAGLSVTTHTTSGTVYYDGEDSMPPRSVREWLGADHGLFQSAAYWNDTYGMTFKEIAERVRQEVG